jgi:hypothetical protein
MKSNRRSVRVAECLATLTLLSPVAAAQQRPAARPLGPAVATSEPFVALSAVRELPRGQVLVNDPGSRRVLLLDSLLKVVRVVADSTPTTANAYGARPGGLIAYRGDSTLFVDPSSLSMLVIDPDGKIMRIIAAPRPNDLGFLLGGPFGNPGIDARGRLIYRTRETVIWAPRVPDRPTTGAAPDTTPLLRYDLATRALDTAAFVKIPQERHYVVTTTNSMSGWSLINPIPVVDEWAVLEDGSIAILRGSDYHLDLLAPDGARASGKKIPFDWQRLTDEDKIRIIDSTRTAMEERRAKGRGRLVLGGAPASGGTESRNVTITTTIDAASGARQSTIGTAPVGPSSDPIFVPANDLPDYRPAFANGAMRADPEGLLWVRTIPTGPLRGGPEYDVIDRSGALRERVAIPKGTTIIGFGSGGIVYLGARDDAGTHLVRARMR